MKKMENIPIKSEVALCRSDGFARGYLPFFPKLYYRVCEFLAVCSINIIGLMFDFQNMCHACLFFMKHRRKEEENNNKKMKN